MKSFLPPLAMLALAGCSDAGTSSHDHDHAHDEGDHQHAPVPAMPAAPAWSPDVGTDGYAWNLPPGMPKPQVPANNPMSAAKVELGRHLFYDRRLSGNQTQSCASCHRQELAFTDGRAQSTGSTGELTPRSSMGLANVAYATTLTWANPFLLDLEAQAAVPTFAHDPVELGLLGLEEELVRRLAAEPRYQALFPEAFPGEQPAITVGNTLRAVAAFQRTLISGRSAYDRFIYGGEPNAMSESARRGLTLFNSERLECFHCHQGFNFADSVMWEGSVREVRFHNTGLYNIDGKGGYPAGGIGVLEVSHAAKDMGAFRTASLRNIALTAPYMHDGSIATLDAVIDHYAAGGRTLASGPHAGNGSVNPLKSGLIRGFEISPSERADLLAFLESLTDHEFIENPAHADPWSQPCALCTP